MSKETDKSKELDISKELDDVILKFFRDDVKNIMITDEAGEIVYSDEKSRTLQREVTNWTVGCPLPRAEQKGEVWDLLEREEGQNRMVITSTIHLAGRRMQIHYLVDNSMYVELFKEMSDYSKELKEEKDHDGLTGLLNKGRFLELRKTTFREQNSIAVYNIDVNNLKRMNDTYGHEAGDRLLVRGAESLRRVVDFNVLAFRVGGDEFIMVYLNPTREEADALLARWRDELDKLNREDESFKCIMSCGMVYAEREYDFDQLLEESDKLMYEEKVRIKALDNSI